MPLNDGENVVEIVGDPGGELTDGLHFDGVPELSFQGEAFSDIGGVAVDDFILDQRNERPGDGVALDDGVEIAFIFAAEEGLGDDLVDIGRDDGEDGFVSEGSREAAGGVVAVSQGSVRSELQDGVGVGAREGGQPLNSFVWGHVVGIMMTFWGEASAAGELFNSKRFDWVGLGESSFFGAT
jgi:hypothetical protein